MRLETIANATARNRGGGVCLIPAGTQSAEMVGRAKGLMETRDPGYRGKRCREGFQNPRTDSARRASCSQGLFPLAPGPATLPTIRIEATTVYSKKDEEFIEKRSRENLVETYREELLKIIRGYPRMDFIPTSVRRRLREDGVLKRSSGKYTVTERGREMLKSRGGGEG